MGKKYKQLSGMERKEIFLLREKGYSLREIGEALGRDKGTVSRELLRNKNERTITAKNNNNSGYAQLMAFMATSF